MANPIRRSIDVTGRLQGSINPRNQWDVAYAQSVTSGKFKPHRSKMAKYFSMLGSEYANIPNEIIAEITKSEKTLEFFKKELEPNLFITFKMQDKFSIGLQESERGQLIIERK